LLESPDRDRVAQSRGEFIAKVNAESAPSRNERLPIGTSGAHLFTPTRELEHLIPAVGCAVRILLWPVDDQRVKDEPLQGLDE
jgi:hypothetical protein